MGFIAYGLYDEGELICSIEVPANDEHDAFFDLKSELNPTLNVSHSLVEVVRETIVAKILWWDKRDGHGVAVDDVGNEYYCDVSACRRREVPLENQLIRGEVRNYGDNCTGLVDVRDFLERN